MDLQSGSSDEAPFDRPFLERRRRNHVQHSWPEALDCLHRHLLGYETANQQLRQSEETYRAIFEGAPIGMFQISPDGLIWTVNCAMAQLMGYDSSEQLLAEFPNGTPLTLLDPRLWNKQGAWSDGVDGKSDFELQVCCRGNATKWIRFNVRKVTEGGEICRYEGTAEDVTGRKLNEIRTEFLAYYDLLTGLPNGTLFNKRFAEEISLAHRQNNRAALFLIEFDRFKIINDCLGDQFGDRLLQEIAGRINAGAGEHNFVARIGGAEFAVVLPDIGSAKRAVGIAKRVVAKLGAEYSLLGHSLNVFCSLGISIFPENGRDCETLMKRADVAMRSAKTDGANNFQLFTEKLNSQIQERLRLENGLRQALSRNELFLEYQPQVDVRTGAVTGLEALLRWRHQELGLIPPSRFIGVAENSGLIVPIGEWVLRSACYQARKWQKHGLPAASMAVNVSAVQFRQPGFCESVRKVLKDTGLTPELLELELTESLLLSNADVMSTVITELREMGVMVAIDDFGTGYSSLGYLKQFKVNRLKIARPFVQDVALDPDDAAITTAIIRMAKAMNLSVLAEGVENEAQLSFLRAQHCYTIQGFYFSKPAGVDNVGRYLRNGFSHLISAVQ